MTDERRSPALPLTRRSLMNSAMVLAATAMLAPLRIAVAGTTPKLPADPFKMLGVASSDPTPDGVVLWRRLALDLEDGQRWGLSEEAYLVGWEVRDLEADVQPVVGPSVHRASGRLHLRDGLRPVLLQRLRNHYAPR